MERARPSSSDRQMERANGFCCMSRGRPRMCIRMSGTPLARATSAMRGSKRRPLMSFTMAAPASTARSATRALVVSMEIGMDGSLRRRPLMMGSTRASSSSAVTGREPGRVDSPPTSIQSAPVARHLHAAADGRSRVEIEAAVGK